MTEADWIEAIVENTENLLPFSDWLEEVMDNVSGAECARWAARTERKPIKSHLTYLKNKEEGQRDKHIDSFDWRADTEHVGMSMYRHAYLPKKLFEAVAINKPSRIWNFCEHRTEAEAWTALFDGWRRIGGLHED